MMREIHGVADEPRTRRRWFHDDFFDLFVWQTSTGDVTLFQLCYGVSSSERALVWSRYGGFFHDGTGVDRADPDKVIGRAGPGSPLTDDPVIVRFEAAARSLPEDIHSIVLARLHEYIETGPVPARRRRFRRDDWQQPPPPLSSKSGKRA